MMKVKLKKARSPNYPVVDLRTALDYAERFRKFARGEHPVPIAAVIGEAWGMKSKSTYGKQVVAALKAYGLVADTGSLDQRQIAITPEASKIIEKHSDRERLIREAAISPKVYTELWERYKDQKELPPDATIRQYLIFDRQGNRFNGATVDGFISIFRETISFAKVFDVGTIGGEPGKIEGKGGRGGPSDKPPAENSVVNPPSGTLALPVLMDSGEIVMVNVPKMTESAFTFFKSLLDTYKSAIVVQPVAKQQESESQQDDE